MPREHEEYLGDGVYASFDGHCVWLDLRGQAMGSHVCEIALEPQVLRALAKYTRRVDPGFGSE